MYAAINFKTKKALKEAIAAGQKIGVFQPNADLTGAHAPYNGSVFLEGPHYPAPHTWYARAELRQGYIISVK